MSRQYKEFKVGDLFDVYVGKRVVKKNWEEGDIPYVTASIKNNGIDGYIGNPVFTVSNLLTINFFGNTFYHPYEISIKDGTWGYKLKEKYKETEAIYLYMASVINQKFEGKGKYDDALNAGIISSSKIYLPITPQGDPDWKYMEDFMKEIESETQQTIETLDKISTISSVGGVSSYPEPYKYKEFKIGDLFEYERGKVKAPKQVEEGNIPMVSETNLNNGVDRFVDFDAVHKGGCVTVSVNYARNVFYQEESFCASVNIIIIRNDLLNKYNGLYISSVLSSNNKKYSYTDKISKAKLMEAHISLPITSQGVPDWQYMEDFMRNIEQESEEVINKIQNMS